MKKDLSESKQNKIAEKTSIAVAPKTITDKFPYNLPTKTRGNDKPAAVMADGGVGSDGNDGSNVKC
jgi:hypothetical protein